MTRTGADHGDGPASTAISAERDGTPPSGDAKSQGELVERLRHNAVQLLAGVPRPPRSLRIRAGEVSVDVEWAEEPTASREPSSPRGHAGSGDDRAGAPALRGSSDLGDPDGGAGVDPARCYLTAPTVGTFYRAPGPGAPPFVAEGTTVTVGQQVGIVEAMKVMIPVEADIDGRVAEVLKGDGDPVEYGERLFALTVEPAPAPATKTATETETES